jgi:diguanylate cyclase (GGDEF)-like protein
MRRNGRLAACAVAVLALALELHFKWGGSFVTRAVDDLGEILAAATAGAAGILRAVRSSGRTRLSWALVGAGAAAWAAGQAVWSYYELLGHRQTPFPSLADAGYLSFTVLALAGLLVRRGGGFDPHRRSRAVLDGLLIAASLFALTWASALGQVYAAGGDTAFAAVVSLAYPVGDLLLLTLTLVVVSHARGAARQGLGILAAAFAALSIADSGFAYLTATNQYQTGNLIDAGWVAGFLLLAVAAWQAEPEVVVQSPAVTSRAALLLPYVPAIGGLVIAAYRVRGSHNDDVSLFAAAFIVIVLLVRQVLILDENRRLTAAISHQAFHDQLTGLANRALFNDRLTHALLLHRRTLQPLTLLVVDLDDFKSINDTLGHASGDEVLRRSAERLRGATRNGDTVARLGGDEFAILGELGADGNTLAERVLAALDVPIPVGSRDVTVRASIGIAELTADEPPVDSSELMHRADAAMYTGKRQGKARAVRYEAAREAAESGLVASWLN